jgi:cell division initiation protein
LKLTPLEIRKQEFRKSMRGFDPVEVQTFLEMVAEQYEQLQEENKSLSRQVLELETRLKSYQENEKTLRDTLLNLQEVKRQSEEASRRQADLQIKEAELKAMEIIESARKEAQKIRDEVQWLKTQKESFINRIRHVLVSQMELLSVMELDDVLSPEANEMLNRWRKNRSLQPPAAAEASPTVEAPQAEPASPQTETATPAEPSEASSPEIVEPSGQSPDESKKKSLTDDDIDDFFKKGLQIDDLIKNINKNK